MPTTDLSNELGLLSQSQLETITFESGVDKNGTVPASNTYWDSTATTAHTWQTALGTGASGITYNFAVANDGTVFSQTAQSAAVQALALWSDIANINFTQYTGSGPLNVSMELANETYGKTKLDAGTSYEVTDANLAPTATANLTRETFGTLQFDLGGLYGIPGVYDDGSDGYGVSALVHEVGHLLGLGHTGAYNFVKGGPTDFGPQAFNETDVRAWSTMSYIDPRDQTDPNYASFTPPGLDWLTPGETPPPGDLDRRAPYTPMALDIFAAQRLYGAPTNGVLSGGQVFGFNTNIMFTDTDGISKPLSMYDFDAGSDTLPVVTLYDYGTNNTLDLSGFAAASTVNLNSGAWTSAAGMINNIFIEYGTQIDTAIGGADNDVFALNGNGDTIVGGGGTANVAFLPGTDADYTKSGFGTVTYTRISTGAVNTLTSIQNVMFATVTWIGPTSGAYGHAGNWSTGKVPGATDDAGIVSSANVVFSKDTSEVDSVQIAPAATLRIDSGFIVIDNAAMSSTNLGEIDIVGGQILLAGSLINNGMIQINSGGNLLTNDHTAAIGGTGTILMTQGRIGGRTFADTTPFDTFVNAGGLIEGSGNIGLSGFNNAITFINQSMVDANQALFPLAFQGAIVNQATMEASNGGTLQLGGAIDNSSDVAGTGTGHIEALDGSTVEIGNITSPGGTTTLTGGTLTQSGTGKIEITGKTIFDGGKGSGTTPGITLSGAVVLDKNVILTLTGKISGGSIDATDGQVLLSGAAVSGVQLKGHIGFGGGGNFLYSAPSGALHQTDIAGLTLGGGAGVTLAADPDHGNNAIFNTGTFTINKGGVLGIAGIIAISDGGVGGGSGLISMTDSSAVIAGTPGGGTFSNYDELVLFNASIVGTGLITDMQVENYFQGGTIMAKGGTLTLNTGTALIQSGGQKIPERIISDGWIGAAAGSDLVIMGTLVLTANILDGSSPEGALSGDGTITLGGSIITGEKAGTIQGGTIQAGLDLEVAAQGGGLNGVVNNDDIRVSGGALLTLAGISTHLINNGAILLNGSVDAGVHHGASIAPVGDTTLNGTGTIRLGNTGDLNSADDRIFSVKSTDTLESGNHIGGFGTLGGSYLNFNNFSTVSADVATAHLIVDGGSLSGVAGQIENDGLMRATNGGTLVVNSSILDYGLQILFDPTPVPFGGGEIGAFGPHSAVELHAGTITAGRLSTTGGGVIDVTGNVTLAGGPTFFPARETTAFGGTASVVNTKVVGAQTDGAVAGLLNNEGRMVVAWEDESANAVGAPTTVGGETLYPPVVRFQVLGRYGEKLFATDLTAEDPVAGESQSHPQVAALSNGGFVITWLRSDLIGGTTTIRAAMFNPDLSRHGAVITVPVNGSGNAVQDVIGLSTGGFASVWSDAAPPGTASTMHVQRFNANGVAGSILDLPSAGFAPTIALIPGGNGAYAVAWFAPNAAGGFGAVDGTMFVEFFNSAGVATSTVHAVNSSSTAFAAQIQVAADGTITGAPYIEPDPGINGVTLFWNDPVNHPGALQGQGYTFGGFATGFTNLASNLDYGGQLTATTAVLPSGALATMLNQPRSGDAPYTDVGLQLAAGAPSANTLVNFADIEVKSGNTLSVLTGLTNNGLIALSSAGGAVLAPSGTVTINGSGTITLDNLTDRISGATGTDVFNNQGNIILGQGTIGGNNLSFTNFGIVDATKGTLTVGGSGKFMNQGVMEATGATLVINGPIINEGYIETVGAGRPNSFVVINGPVLDQDFFSGYLEILGGVMVLGSSVGVTQNVFFSSTVPGELILSDPVEMKGTILFLNQGNTIDVGGVVATSSNFDSNNGKLNLLANGATLATINVQGMTFGDKITLTSDHNGGTLVELVPSTFSGFGAAPSLAVLPGGQYVAIYQASSGGTPIGGIYGQIFTRDGVLQNFLSIDPSGTQSTVAARSSGQFMVAWTNDTTNTIQGAIFNADGSVAKSTFSLTPPTGGIKYLDPSISAEPDGYLLTYDADDPSSKSVATYYQAFNISGLPIGTATAYPAVALNEVGVAVPITNVYTPRVAHTGILGAIEAETNSFVHDFAPIIAAVDDFAQYSAANPSAIAMTFPDPSSLFGLFAASAQAPGSSIAISNSVAPTTVLLTPIDDGVTRVSPEIAALTNGDFVGVWDQRAQGDSTWTVAGQIVDPTGKFVGPGFTISTADPIASTPSRPVLNALPNGAFTVIYNDADSSLAGQKFDASATPVGDPFGVTNSADGNSDAIVLSDGTLLTLSGSGGLVTSSTFSLQAALATWTGTGGTNLGVAGNWQPVAIPDASETLSFGIATGGTLTGSATGMNAVVTGNGGWLLQNATLILAGEAVAPGSLLALTANSPLTVSGGSIAASGSLDIETPTGATMTVLDGAQVAIQGITMGLGAGESGGLAVNGAGTTILNTGTSGSFEVGGSGSGQVTVSGGATVSSSAGAILGAGIGGDGTLNVSGLGSKFGVTGEIDIGSGGSGHLGIANGATVGSGGNAAAPTQGFDVGQAAGSSGDVSVGGSGSLLNNAGRFIIGDAGLGGLSINAGGAVATSSDATIANAASASGAVNITGASSRLQVAGALVVGNAGFGQLSISQSATVTATSADAAAASGGDGAISVTGTGSALNITGQLIVGDQSSGSLNIVNGASVTAGGLSIGAGASGSGNVVIGPGSHLTLTGTSINVGLAGSGVLDIQGGTLALVAGTTLSPGTFGRIVQVGGLIDPATVFDASGGSFGGGGTAEASGTIVNSSLATVSGGAETLLAPLITSSDSVNVAGVWSIKSGGTLVLDVNTFDNSQTIQFADLTGVLTIGQQVTLDATQTPQPIAASALDGFAAPIVGYKAGDKITFTGLGVASDQVSGNVVTLFDSGHNTLGSLTFQTGKGGADKAGATAAAAQIVPCFAAGTRIETAAGFVAVEDLTVGDSVVVADGGLESIVWVGQRSVNCRAHPRPETVWPVRVAAGAFGGNIPVRDLYLSPDHAVFVNAVLVPVKLLINGTNITQVKRDHVTYFHVELPRHDVILAEGLTVESYLDLGDRANFRGDNGVIRLHPDFTARLAPETALLWETRGAARLVMTGDELDLARRHVSALSFVNPDTAVPVREFGSAAL